MLSVTFLNVNLTYSPTVSLDFLTKFRFDASLFYFTFFSLHFCVFYSSHNFKFDHFKTTTTTRINFITTLFCLILIKFLRVYYYLHSFTIATSNYLVSITIYYISHDDNGTSFILSNNYLFY